MQIQKIMNPKPLFSVIIPTCCRNGLLAKCLERLAPRVQTLSKKYYEVIVSDDCSETGAKKLVHEKYPWVRWVQGPMKGPAANRNNGSKYAKGEWLAFIDDDCLPESNWLSSFVKAANGKTLALEGAILPLGDFYHDSLIRCPINLDGGRFWSANIAVKKSLFREVGGFDSNYRIASNEDWDLKLRISEFTKILFVPESRIRHPVKPISFRMEMSNIHKRCANWSYHMKKHRIRLGYKRNLRAILGSYKFYGFNLLYYLCRFQFKAAVLSLIYLIIGLPLILPTYRESFLTRLCIKELRNLQN